jgi:tetratricopeptide (TPR) repeat protein
MTESPSPLAALVDELKRRRVFNVAAVYLVGMWLLIQIADITFTRLGMPDWTVTFVIVAGALMFPVVVALAWAFDLTRSGITRTPALPPPALPPPADAGPHHAAAPGADVPVASPGLRRQRRLTLTLAAVMTVPLLGFGMWWTGARGVRGASLDTDLMVVTPFRLAGASEELSYLREGLMDLIAARIGGAGAELSVVPPRSVSRLIRETLGSLDVDPDRDEARSIATRFGAGLLLEGEIIGTAASFTVTTRLVDVRTGYRLDTAELKAHPDSLHDLIDRIATRLIAAESGVRQDRLAAITTASMPALRAFLEGEQAFRRGDHDRAVRSYDRAVSIDSTFALAALGLLRADGWAVGLESANAGRAERIVRRGMDRLSEPDRLFAEALFGHGAEPYRELVDRRIRAARLMPDLMELQYLAGDGLLHHGQAVGIADAFAAARAYFERTIEMDSTYLEPLVHLHDLASLEKDTAGVRRYGDLLLAIDASGPMATAVRVERMRGGAGPTTHPPIDLDTLDFQHLIATATSTWFDSPNPAFTTALNRQFEKEATIQDRVRVADAVLFMAILQGRPSMLERASRVLAEAGGADDISRLARALYWTRDIGAARAASVEVRRLLDQARREAPPDGHASFEITGRECMLGHLRAAERDARALEHAAFLERAVRPDRSPLLNAYDSTCADFLRTAAAVHANAPDALARMEVLHSSLAAGVRRPPATLSVYDLASIDLWEQLGRPDRALEASRRYVYLPVHGLWIVELYGENARLADQLGHRDEAIRSYGFYLAWRDDAEGVFAERAEQARRGLQRLLGSDR